MTTRRPVKPSGPPLVLMVVLALIVVGVPVGIGVASMRLAADSRAKEARAEAEVTRQAQAYAAAVVAAGEPAPSDERLAAATEGTRVRIWEVRRLPDLLVIVYVSARFGARFGAGTVAACHQVTFHDLGTASAGSVVERLAACPPPVPGPTPS